MSGGVARLWSWVLIAAMVAAAVWPRFAVACGCFGAPGAEATGAAELEVDACCGGHAERAEADPTAPADRGARFPCDEEHGCSCELACCGVARPALAPGGVAAPRLAASKSGVYEGAPLPACVTPGFAGDLFRPPRA